MASGSNHRYKLRQHLHAAGQQLNTVAPEFEVVIFSSTGAYQAACQLTMNGSNLASNVDNCPEFYSGLMILFTMLSSSKEDARTRARQAVMDVCSALTTNTPKVKKFPVTVTVKGSKALGKTAKAVSKAAGNATEALEGGGYEREVDSPQGTGQVSNGAYRGFSCMGVSPASAHEGDHGHDAIGSLSLQGSPSMPPLPILPPGQSVLLRANNRLLGTTTTAPQFSGGLHVNEHEDFNNGMEEIRPPQLLGMLEATRLLGSPRSSPAVPPHAKRLPGVATTAAAWTGIGAAAARTAAGAVTGTAADAPVTVVNAAAGMGLTAAGMGPGAAAGMGAGAAGMGAGAAGMGAGTAAGMGAGASAGMGLGAAVWMGLAAAGMGAGTAAGMGAGTAAGMGAGTAAGMGAGAAAGMGAGAAAGMGAGTAAGMGAGTAAGMGAGAAAWMGLAAAGMGAGTAAGMGAGTAAGMGAGTAAGMGAGAAAGMGAGAAGMGAGTAAGMGAGAAAGMGAGAASRTATRAARPKVHTAGGASAASKVRRTPRLPMPSSKARDEEEGGARHATRRPAPVHSGDTSASDWKLMGLDEMQARVEAVLSDNKKHLLLLVYKHVHDRLTVKQQQQLTWYQELHEAVGQVKTIAL